MVEIEVKLEGVVERMLEDINIEVPPTSVMLVAGSLSQDQIEGEYFSP